MRRRAVSWTCWPELDGGWRLSPSQTYKRTLAAALPAEIDMGLYGKEALSDESVIR